MQPFPFYAGAIAGGMVRGYHVGRLGTGYKSDPIQWRLNGLAFSIESRVNEGFIFGLCFAQHRRDEALERRVIGHLREFAYGLAGIH